MAITPTVLRIDNKQKRIERVIQLVLTGSYTTGGDTLDLTKLVAGPGGSMEAVLFHRNPDIYGIKHFPQGYFAELIPGNALNNWLLKIYTANLTELTQAAYPAGLLAATTIFLELEEKAS